MKNEFVTVKQAFNLKKIGFNEPCLLIAYKNEKIDYKELSWHTASNTKIDKTTKEINKELDLGVDDEGKDVIMPEGAAVPLIRQAFRWFREKHKINSGIVPYYDYFYFIIKNFGSGEEYYSDDMIELTYEEAESACLDKLIEIVKNKN
jgi:hypothetical protein